MSGEAAVPLARLREAVAARAEATSLRRVAREIGVSPSGLHYFLRGGSPYSPTRHKLERWYVREAPAPYEGLSAGAVRALLSAMVQDLPPSARRPAMDAILAATAAAYRARGVVPPGWLTTLLTDE
jgi:hypothetical protein